MLKTPKTNKGIPPMLGQIVETLEQFLFCQLLSLVFETARDNNLTGKSTKINVIPAVAILGKLSLGLSDGLFTSGLLHGNKKYF